MFAPITRAAAVVAAVDRSELASLVARRALDTAREMNATQLHFIHVHVAAPRDDAAQRCNELGAWIAGQLSAGPALPRGLQVLAHESGGEPAESIVALATTLGASCIVVGAHCRGGKRLLGPVARAVIGSANCPVLVVRPEVQSSGRTLFFEAHAG
jgi:nucleotide-binding universal stress UspA family protein